MKRFTLHIFILTILGIVLFGFKKDTQETKSHKVKVLHPGISEKDSIDCILIELDEKQLNSKAFYMDVETVVCGDQQCKIDIIRIHWNQFGAYLKYELLNNVQLEKTEGSHFSATDYNKLDLILKDSNSPLRDVYKNEIVSNNNGEGFDAVSGETILLDKSAYVKGAVWTCYTLWHWVHGNTKNHIRNITGDRYSTSTLINLLESDISNKRSFAIDQIIKKEDYSKSTKIAVKNFLIKYPSNTKKGIQYFESMGVEESSTEILELYKIANLENRKRYLELIKQSEKSSENFYSNLLDLIELNPSFEELNLFIEILDKKNLTQGFINKLMIFLENDSFLISRRVYWVLNEYDLEKNQQIILKNYYNEHQDKL